jgi:folate-binding protein YgfZ
MSDPVGVDLSGAGGLGVLAFRGVDAARFLQGQLSADTEKLSPGASTLAGLHNAQGRVIALLALVRPSRDEFFAVLPRELAGRVAQTLGKFLFRAKVRISDESENLRVLGAPAGAPHAGIAELAWSDRRLLLVPRDQSPSGGPGFAGQGTALTLWERSDVAGGMPQIYAATSEAFVAQMLNLDLLGSIAFDKGCYTGQEVIARAHYRGRVKRRMQRWRHASATPLAPGDSAQAADGRTLTVVRVAPGGVDGYELLAVGNFAAPAAETPAQSFAGGGLEGPLPLPYSLPE